MSSNNRTDAELDADWQPSGRRPQSTIAQSFSQELMDIFKIDNSIVDLDNQVKTRQQQVRGHTTELETLEARIREMEQRLKGVPPTAQQPAGAATLQTAPASESQRSQTSRPGTAKPAQQQPIHGGAMPPTPTASEDGGDRDQ
ncbi:intracellular multiplication protein IcmG [Microdochium nivale]|nr:intracellular multiplication protein IcmG [Microdochium nivale]